MLSFRYMWLVLFVLLLVACGEKGGKLGKISEDGSYEVKINISAGDDYYEIVNQDTFSFTPYPYNFGSIRSNTETELSCLVLSNRLSKNSRIKILPIGLLNYQERGQSKKLIIGVPRDSDKRVIKSVELFDLVAKYPAIKNIIQEWTLGKCGIGCSKFLSWEDESAASLWVQRNLS